MGVGSGVGLGVGSRVGCAVGLSVGSLVGRLLGWMVGVSVGLSVGLTVGLLVGLIVGLAVGLKVGSAVGRAVGADVSWQPLLQVASVSSYVHSSVVPVSVSSQFTTIPVHCVDVSEHDISTSLRQDRLDMYISVVSHSAPSSQFKKHASSTICVAYTI